MSIKPTPADKITYEQPLNEPMRICLQLEHLFDQINHHTESLTMESSQFAIDTLAKILDVVSRPDIKSKLSQTLTQYATTIGQLENFPDINPERLNDMLKKLDHLIAWFHQQKTRIGESLRNNEFMNQLRLQRGNPGGLCPYTIPAYRLWLNTPKSKQTEDLRTWLNEFSELNQAARLILYIIRNSNPSQPVQAKAGFYQQNLNPALPVEMLRITLPTQHHTFPEFSVGKHRLAIRFLNPKYHDNGRPQPIHENIAFDLTCCRI